MLHKRFCNGSCFVLLDIYKYDLVVLQFSKKKKNIIKIYKYSLNIYFSPVEF